MRRSKFGLAARASDSPMLHNPPQSDSDSYSLDLIVVTERLNKLSSLEQSNQSTFINTHIQTIRSPGDLKDQLSN